MTEKTDKEKITILSSSYFILWETVRVVLNSIVNSVSHQEAVNIATGALKVLNDKSPFNDILKNSDV